MLGLIIIILISAVTSGVVSYHLTKNRARFEKYETDSKKEAEQGDSGFDVTIDL